MFTKKTPISWPIIAAVVIITAIFFQVASALLRSNNENIAFIEKELRGLNDYTSILPLYLEIYRDKNPRETIPKLLSLQAPMNVTTWDKAKDALLMAGSTADAGKAIRDLIRDIGDQSNLILDPALESYYAISLLFNHIPKLAEAAASANINTYSFEDMDHAVQILSQQQLAGNSSLRHSADQIKTSLHRPNNRQALLTHVEALSESARNILETLLQKRLTDQKFQRAISLAIIISLYGFLLFLIVFAVQNYVTRREFNSAREREGLISKLADKNNELETFTYATAHDLREPVRTIRCFTSLLKKEVGAELGACALEYTAVIERTSRRAEQMINGLLDYATLNEESLVPEHCDCAEEISAVLEDLKSTIEIVRPNIIVGPMPIILTVPDLFRRIVLNLVDNAIKYRNKNSVPVIHIDAQRQDNGWLFSIEDNGIGIEPAHRQTVFEPFRRLYPEQYSEGEGIGLTSCKKIVEMLGGSIWLGSKPQAGTTVYFSIPATSEL